MTAVSGSGTVYLTLATALDLISLLWGDGFLAVTYGRQLPVYRYFSEPSSDAVSKSTGLSLGTIPAGSCKAFWYQRLAENSTL